MRILAYPKTLFLAAILSLPLTAPAAIITFQLDSLHPTSQLNYSVTAGANEKINEFTIFFNPSLYKNLTVATSPTAWDSLVIQPDTGIPANGFFDSLNNGAGIQGGTTLDGFAVSFLYTGTGMPGSQDFEIVNPMTFATLSSGRTTAFEIAPPLSPPPQPPTTNVPEPATIGLIGLAAILLASQRKRD